MKPYRILLPLSLVYGMIMAIRNAFFEKKIFRSHAVSIPVISVGNMTTGGTGKTPIVELIASLVRSRGVRAAVVSRGYHRRSEGLVLVSDGSEVRADADRSGDEPHQLAVNLLPGVAVIVDERRARGARYAQDELHAGCVILDDGFQHRALKRTCDIVLIDAEHDILSMPMLPAGHRREPLSSLGRADAFIITKCSERTAVGPIVQGLRAYNAHAPVLTSAYLPEALIESGTGAVIECEAARGMKAVAFCGIGTPESFTQTVESLGIAVGAFHRFADHHRYGGEDFRMLDASRAASGSRILLTTEKDAHRIAGRFHPGAPLYYVKMRARINETDVLNDVIGSALSSAPV